MSNDLISRSAVIKAIHDFVEQHRNDDEIQWTGYDWLLKEDSVIDIINNPPTAYDVDKVVERLKEESDFTTGEDGTVIDEHVRLQTAIDAVKSGGIE